MGQIDPVEWAQFEAADKMVKLYTKIRDGYKAKFQADLGDETDAKVGEEVKATWEYADQYRTADFKKHHPELFEAFAYSVSKDVVNWDLLRRAHPNLVREYQSRKFVIK